MSDRRYIVKVHIAGESEGLLQRCVRCGEILIDARGAMVLGLSGTIGAWAPGFVGETLCVEDGTIYRSNPWFAMERDAKGDDEMQCGVVQ